jgi:hypothetical protein
MAHDVGTARITGHEHWDPLTLDEVLVRFAALDVPWWVAGGIAIDLFLGWETRHHDDIDLEMFREDREILFAVFKGWDLHAAMGGGLAPWTEDEPLDSDAFAIWGRPHMRAPWAVEILLASGDVGEWRFRRDPTITMAGDRLIRTTGGGVPYCTPEVQLLYKAKRSRRKDDVDLSRCLHRMERSQAMWLRDALTRLDATHPWVAVLDHAISGTPAL